ncbi:MAG TPA: hypothetical protein VF607_16480, partial [Verrucomicrobiae bacterium]
GDGSTDYPLTGIISNSATVNFNVAASRFFNDSLCGNGRWNINGPGQFMFAGTNYGNGNLTCLGVTLALSAAAQFNDANLTLGTGSGLKFSNPAVNNSTPVTMGSLNLSNAAIVIDLAGSSLGTASLAVVTGICQLQGQTTVQLLNASNLLPGRYPLLSYGSYQAAGGNVVAISGQRPGMLAGLENNPANQSLDLVVASIEPEIAAAIQPGNLLTLAWSVAYTGWQLQYQTNSLARGLGTNWFGLNGSELTNQFAQAIDKGTPAKFFRLVYPPTNAANGPIFSNAAFVFYPDRMESSDMYAGIFRSTNGMSITEDGYPGYTWTNPQVGQLYLQTPYPILDATFALAVDALFKVRAPAGTTSAMLSGYNPGSIYYVPYFYMTHGSDIREYTRDYAQEIQWGDIALLDPVATRGTLIRRCDITNNIIREDAVVTSDSIHFISAAWEYFKITGDTNFLQTCWSCMWNTMTNKENTYLDRADGLWYGGPWSDNVSGYVTTGDFNNRLTQLKSLYGNLLVAMAWRDLANIADTLGVAGVGTLCRSKAAASKTAINTGLYRPDWGTYCYYKNVVSNTVYQYAEDMSAGLLYLSGVASNSACLAYHSNFTATPYGYRNVDPIMPAGQTSYHGGNVWEDEEGYHGWAMALLGQPEELAPFIFWHARAGLPLKKWQEGTINPTTGQLHVNYTWVSWGATGYTSYWTRGVFGIIYNPGNLQFAPCVPHS